MSVKKYAIESIKSKTDYKIFTAHGLELTLTPIIEDYGIPMTANVMWVMQHWRAIPRPKIGCNDQREFGYFMWDGNELTYRIIPADEIVISKGLEIIPLQSRRVFVPRRVPSAVNYFPNSKIVIDSINSKYLLKAVI